MYYRKIKSGRWLFEIQKIGYPRLRKFLTSCLCYLFRNTFIRFTFNKHTIDRFKVVADKDMRKMSNIIENLIRRYVESRV